MFVGGSVEPVAGPSDIPQVGQHRGRASGLSPDDVSSSQNQCFRAVVGALHAAVYAAGAITYHSGAAAALWGHHPDLWKLYWRSAVSQKR